MAGQVTVCRGRYRLDCDLRLPLEDAMKPNIFAIYLTEEDDGTVIAKAEIVGRPTRSMDIGIEIMDGLKRLERDAAGLFKVQRFMQSSDSTH